MELLKICTFVIFVVVGLFSDHVTPEPHNVFERALQPYSKQIRQWSENLGKDDKSVGILVDYFGCDLCTVMIAAVERILATGNMDDMYIEEMVIRACESLDLAPKPEICDPIVKAYRPQFLYLLKHIPGGTSNICGILNSGCGTIDPEKVDWRIKIDRNKPDLVERPWIPDGVSEMKILQFTDIHLDLDYKEGTTSSCGSGMPICCRDEYGYPDTPESPDIAGKYGDFMCGLPMTALEGVYTSAKELYPDTKYIFLTGDYVHSGVWKYSVEENSRHIKAATEKLIEVFNGTRVRIFPLTGNHEAHVINMYPPVELWDKEGFDLSWMYKSVVEPFIAYDPDLIPAEQISNFVTYGYYSVSPEPGLRILAINTNLCYEENFWLAYYAVDPNNQLQWLADQLWSAEIAEESVFIIGHVQPGSCWPVWSERFDMIVSRFEGIIRAQFYGHSHRPQLRLNFEKGTSRPTSTSFIAGSVLTDSMNPSYAAYYVDGDRGIESTWDVMRQDLLVLNLAKSNEQREVIVEKINDSKDDFGMEDLRPESVFKFATRLICDQALLDQYIVYHTKGKDSKAHYSCSIETNVDCLVDTLCTIFSSNANDAGPCKEIERVVKSFDCDSIRGDGGESGGVGVTASFYFIVFLFLLNLF